MTATMLFDRRARCLHRDRAARSGADAFVHARAFDEALERLGYVKRAFGRALLLGCPDPVWRARLEKVVPDVVVADPSLVFARAARGIVADEDRLPFADAAFDLVLAVGTLDGVDDLPGALLLIRRILRPDGLMLAAMAGAGSLPRLKAAMLAADAATGRGAAARMHPAIDVRTAGDLLARAGFALPVADVESLDVSYRDFRTLVADLRAHGGGNALARRSRVPLGRRALAAAVADFASHARDGRTIERVEILHLSGWAPAPSQPKPLQPGSAAVSLTGILDP